MKVFCYTLLAFLIVPSFVMAEKPWNQFRGPNGNGKTSATNLPVKFNETKNIRWKTPIHNQGWSSPVVWGNQIWLTTATEGGTELFAICVDLESGKIIHDIKVFDVAHPQLTMPQMNTHASPTPIVEEGRVYVHFGSYGTACLDTKTGKKLWERRDLNCDHRVRAGSSPIIDGDLLFLTYDGLDVKFIVALDKNSGKTVWIRNRDIESEDVGTEKVPPAQKPEESNAIYKTELATGTKIEDTDKAFATPTIIEHQGKKQLISPAVRVTFSYDPKTGEELWRVLHGPSGWNDACRPIYENQLVYLTIGIGKQLLAIDPSGTGDITDTHIVWNTKKTVPKMPSPLIVDDLLFMIDDNGVASCLDAKTGDQIWRKRIGGNYWASPFYADGRIYLANKDGDVTIIAASREYELLAKNHFDEPFNASPAVAGNALILRSLTHLYCVTNDDE